jgi:hypothetical protein
MLSEKSVSTGVTVLMPVSRLTMQDFATHWNGLIGAFLSGFLAEAATIDLPVSYRLCNSLQLLQSVRPAPGFG